MSQTFAELGLNPERMAGLESLGYEQPSKLQTEVIPQLLAGKDIVAEAAPGSGKTAAYVVSILQTLDPEATGVQVLVITTDGADAGRVAAYFQMLGSGRHLHIVPVAETQPLARETERLDLTAAIVIGTPGRIKEHLERDSFNLDQIQFVVLDDADQLIAGDNLEIIENILDQAPAGRQTAVFAKEVDAKIQELAYQHLFEPVVLKREAGAVAMPIIKHRYQSLASGSKTDALLRLLDGENIDRGLVYVNLRSETERVAQVLMAQGYHAAALHGGNAGDVKDSLVRSWGDDTLDFMVVTDSAAADLVLETDYVISYDVPTDAEAYASRSKLVAETGTQISLVAPRERALLSEIETFLGFRIKAVLPPTRADTVTQRSEAFKQKLVEAINRSNLEIYMPMLSELTQEGYDWSEVAAAAISIIQHANIDTIYTRRPERSSQPQSRYRDTGRSERPPRTERSRPPMRERNEDREVEAGYVRLTMDAGYDIGVRPKDIVGAIANEANIPGRAVGNIDIRDRFTFVEVQDEYVDRVLTRVPSTRLRGRVVSFRRE